MCIILVHLYRSLLLAMVILLPLLGLTWTFGLLAINEHSSAFAWIFTILNSLQVRNIANIMLLAATGHSYVYIKQYSSGT